MILKTQYLNLVIKIILSHLLVILKVLLSRKRYSENMSFRERLREQIEFCGLLDKEVAAKAGITKRAIDSYVGSEACMPSAEVAVKLAKVLNTTVEYLVTGKNPDNSSDSNSFLQELQNPQTRKLIKNYTKLSERDKNLLVSISKEMTDV